MLEGPSQNGFERLGVTQGYAQLFAYVYQLEGQGLLTVELVDVFTVGASGSLRKRLVALTAAGNARWA